MDQDLYGLQASGIDPEIAAQMLGLKRSRGVAEALLKQSMTPLSAGPTPQGGFTPRIHPLQGIAQIVQAYMARKGLEGADTTQAGLAKQNEERTASALGDYEKQRAGTPGMTPLTPNDDEGNVNTSIAATPGDPRAAISSLLAKNAWLSKNPLVQADMAAMKPMVLGRTLVNGTGQTLATDSTWAAEQKAAAEAKKAAQIDSLAAKEEENRVKIEAAAERQRQAAADRENLVRIAGSMRQPPAPTMSEVLDPKDPTRMLRVDAKSYKGGTLGESGVLGVSGKEPTAAKREEQVGTGRETVSTIVNELRDHYKVLNDSGGIVNPEKGTLSNIAAAIASSGAGQVLGGAVGTENQSARNSIAQTRPLLLNAIKQATGMSAKQMDSNAELKMYLAAATDPKLDIKANMAALDNLDKLYGLGINGQPTNISAGKLRRASDAPGKVIDFNSLPK